MFKAKRKLFISVILLLCAGLLVILQINYPITRQSLERMVATQSSALQTRNFLSQYSEHFIIKYLPIDEKYVEIILRGSEQSYDDVVQWFETDAPVPAPELIVFPTAASLASSFGWDRSQQSMGVYWGGSIRILSPAEWMDEPSLEEFCREGPMVHELCHLMVDEVSGGNYSRWFTEGLAQYLEKKINGFAFPQPEMKAVDIMDFAEMENSFDGGQQRIAYWQALQTVEYMVQFYGEDSLRAVLAELKKGTRMNQALGQALEVDFDSFAFGCRHYIEQQIIEVSK